MSKYIIDIPNGIEWGVVTCRTEDGFYTRDFDSLEELNSDYINEHYGELQDEAYQRGINDGSLDVKQRVEGAYQRGLEDAWEAARKIIRMPDGDILDLFPDCYASVCTAVQAILKYDASEAIAKLKSYEEKQKDRIEVGDEVKAPFGTAVVVCCDYDADKASYIYSSGRHGFDNTWNLKKTGKHYDIASILEAMRE